MLKISLLLWQVGGGGVYCRSFEKYKKKTVNDTFHTVEKITRFISNETNDKLRVSQKKNNRFKIIVSLFCLRRSLVF